MATFDMTPRGNFRVDRDSLHESEGYKRQVEALKQLPERKSVMCDLWNKRREKLEQAVKDAAMELFGHTNSAAFRLDLGSGLYVEAGSEGTHLTQPAQAVDVGAIRERDPHPLATGPTKWRAEHCTTHHHACDCREWEHAAQVERLESEIARLQNIADGNAELYQHELLRSGKAEALLRECLTPGFNEISLCSRMRSRITAHLSENSRG